MTRVSIYFLLGLLWLAGCGGPDATVQGTVTVDGQLAPRGTVVFHPVDRGPTAYGTIAENGSYSLRVGQGDLSDPDAGEVPSGEYIVTAVVNVPPTKDETVGESGPPRPGARLTAEKYANKETSDMRVTVKAGSNVVPLELDGASVDEGTLQPEPPGAEVQSVNGIGEGGVDKESADSESGPLESEPHPRTTEPDASIEEQAQ